MDSDRCDDTSAMLSTFGLDVKPLRMVSSPHSGPRHTIDNILGLVNRKEDPDRDRSGTPGNTESAGKFFAMCWGSFWMLMVGFMWKVNDCYEV